MKAVLALIVIYIATFLVAIQGGSSNPVRAAQNASSEAPGARAKGIEAAKEADIRALLELVGARDMIQDAATGSAEQFKEKISATIPNSQRAQNAAAAFTADFERKYDPEALIDQLVGIYDKHYTDDEIKQLMQFYGSPVGQKAALEMPKINREIQTAMRAIANQAARDAWQEIKAENPNATQGAHPFAARRRAQPVTSEDNLKPAKTTQPGTEQP